MKKFILLTFVFLGWAFYEESGGSDFVPRKADLMAAAAEARATAQAERALAQAAKPATPPIAVPVEVALAVKDVTVAPRSDPVPVAEVVAADSPPEVTLVSLEQSGTLFARPLQQLGDEGADPAVPAVFLQPRPADMRLVTGDRVNMRSGPGTSFGVMGSLVRGDEVEVIADDGIGWVKLRTEDGIVGWMADFLLGPSSG